MIKCPFCAEEIQDDAVKCKHCAEWLVKKEPISSEIETPHLIVDYKDRSPGDTITYTALVYYNEGNRLVEINDYEQAIIEFSNAIELNPNYAEAYNYRGNIYADRGEFEQAISDYKEAIKIMPKFADAYNNIVITYYEKGDYNKAKEYIQRMVNLEIDIAPKLVNIFSYDEEIKRLKVKLSYKPDIWKLIVGGALLGGLPLFARELSLSSLIYGAIIGAILLAIPGIFAQSFIKIKYEKIGGWLLFFCITLIILNPLIQLSRIEDYKTTRIYFNNLPGLQTLMIIDIIMTFPLTIFGIIAGVMIVKLKPNAVITTKNFLITQFCFSIIISLYYLIYFANVLPGGLNDKIITECMKGFDKPIGFCILWYLYLSVSKRVKNTFNIA